jgi:hypothetical protein
MVYASGVPRKTPARAHEQPRHSAIILELEPHRDEEGEYPGRAFEVRRDLARTPWWN